MTVEFVRVAEVSISIKKARMYKEHGFSKSKPRVFLDVSQVCLKEITL